MKAILIFLLFPFCVFCQNDFIKIEYDSNTYERPVSVFISTIKYPRTQDEFKDAVAFLLNNFKSPTDRIDLSYLIGIQYNLKFNKIEDWEFEKAIDVLVSESNKFIRKGYMYYTEEDRIKMKKEYKEAIDEIFKKRH